jgi:hypothetical protein
MTTNNIQVPASIVRAYNNDAPMAWSRFNFETSLPANGRAHA